MRYRGVPFSIFIVVFFSMLVNIANAQCVNADFGDGNFQAWGGSYSTGQQCLVNPLDSQGFNQGPNNNSLFDTIHEYSQIITTVAGGNDSVVTLQGGSLPVVWPGGSGYAARLGSLWQELSYSNDFPDNTGDGETMIYTFLVTPSNCNFIYHYAVVLADGGHQTVQQSFFSVQMVDSNNNTIPFASYTTNGFSLPAQGYLHDSTSDIYWKPWSSVWVPLVNYIGHHVTITFTTRGCLPDGCAGSHFCYAYIACEGEPAPLINITPGALCLGVNTKLTAPDGAASYSWSGPGVVSSPDSQEISVAQAGLYSVTMTTFADTPAIFSIDTFIIPASGSLIANFTLPAACANSAVQFTDLSFPHDSITSWAWDFNNSGLSEDTSENPVYVFPSGGTYPVKLTVSSSFCSGDTSINVVISTSPVAMFTEVTPVCAGDSSMIIFTGTAVDSALFNWNVGYGIADTSTGRGPINVSWDSVGFCPVSLTISQYGCISSFADTIPVQICSGIQPINSKQINIYPNPAKNDFTVEVTGAISNARLEINDVLGRVLYTDAINATTGVTKQIHLNVASGVYFVGVYDGDKHYTQKLVIE